MLNHCSNPAPGRQPNPLPISPPGTRLAGAVASLPSTVLACPMGSGTVSLAMMLTEAVKTDCIEAAL